MTDRRATDHENRAGEAPPRRPQRFSMRDWKDALRYVKDSIAKDHLTIVSPGVAFYLLLGIIPAIAALVSIYGLVADPADVQAHFEAMEGMMPAAAGELLSEQMARIAAAQETAGIGALIGLVFALWAASQATSALMQGLNITYGTAENRRVVKQMAVRIGLTLAAVLTGLIAIGVIVVLPPVLDALPLPETVTGLLSFARWPLLLVVAMVGLAVLYRFAPDRPQPRLRWLSWGAAVAAIIWVLASALFSFYVANFGNYNETYGALGAVVILMMWLLITAFAFLLGAEIDIAFERQTENQVESARHDARSHREHPHAV